MKNDMTPQELGFYFPAEFHPQHAMWLSWPHKEASWPGKINSIYEPYCEFVLRVAEHQLVCINVSDAVMEIFAQSKILQAASILQFKDLDGRLANIRYYHHPTNDAWCRDHGPAFLLHRERDEKVIVDWGYNAWGDKYPPYDLDDVVPALTARTLGLPVFHPGIVMEGGSVEFNGRGTILTTTACLLNKNRNPHLNKRQIEQYLIDYYGAEHILWLDEGIVGDDTDGHIDDLTRFVSEDTVVTVVESSASDENYGILKANTEKLHKMRLPDGAPLNVVELPMPSPVIFEDQRLPASYANFYIANRVVIVPTFRDDVNDQKALDTLQQCFPGRSIVGIDSWDIIWGLGSFHCLSQQEPDFIK